MKSVKSWRLSLRIAIVSLITSAIVLSSGLALAISYKGTRESIRILLQHIMIGIKDNFRAQASQYLREASESLEFIGQMSTSGMLEGADMENVHGFLRNIMAKHDHFSAMYFTTREGDLVLLKRMPDRTFSLRVSTRRDGKVMTTWKHEDHRWAESYPDISAAADSENDPRQSTWCRNAVARRGVTWSDVHVSSAGGEPVVTCSLPLFDPQGTLAPEASASVTLASETTMPRNVVGIDIGIEDLSHFLGERALAGTAVFVLNEKEEVIAMPLAPDETASRFLRADDEISGGAGAGDARIGDAGVGGVRLRPVDEIAGEKWRGVLEIFRARDESVSREGDGSPGTFSFSWSGHGYLGLRYSIRDESPWDWHLWMIVPERPFMERVYAMLKVSSALALLIVLASIGLGVLISDRITRPMAALADDMAKIESFDLEGSSNARSRILEVDHMSTAFEGMKVGLRSFRKYVPAELVRKLMRFGHEAMLGGEKRVLTISFSDIEDFTTIAESLPPEILVERLSEYFTAMGEVISRNKGIVDKYIGDCVMAFWGAPDDVPNHAEMACRTALENQRLLNQLNARWAARGQAHFNTRIGISTGEVVVGNMGAAERMNYTVIGDYVNLASRLEGTNKHYGTSIILSESTQKQVSHLFETRLLDHIVVKGKTKAIAIYELICEKGAMDAVDAEMLRIFESAILLYHERKWEAALAKFEEILSRKADVASYVYVERCRDCIENPPGPEWTGLNVLKSK